MCCTGGCRHVAGHTRLLRINRAIATGRNLAAGYQQPADAGSGTTQTCRPGFKQVPGNKWATNAEIIEHDNKTLQAQSTLLLDGTPGKASGTYLVDRAAVKMPEPGVLVMQLMYQGVPASTRTYTVSADGKVMTEIEAYFKDGNPVMRTAYFKRAASQSK